MGVAPVAFASIREALLRRLRAVVAWVAAIGVEVVGITATVFCFMRGRAAAHRSPG